MNLDKILLILTSVVVTAALTIWAASYAVKALGVENPLLVLTPIAMICAVAWRLLAAKRRGHSGDGSDD